MSVSVFIYSGFLALIFLIGALASRRIDTLKDYYVAGGKMPWYMLCGTFIASNVSAGLFLGATDMAAQNGFAVWAAYFSTSIGYLLAIGVVGVLVRRLASHYEILDFADIIAVRYPADRTAIRSIVAVVMPLVYIPALAAQFMALAAISATIFGLDYGQVLLLVVTVIIAFTMMGGMVGVVWTDTFQFFVLVIGLIFAVPLGMSYAGSGDMAVGWSRVIDSADDIFQWQTSGFPWYAAIGQFMWIFALCVQPHLITRFLTAKDETAIIKALPVCMVLSLIIFGSTIPIGLLGGFYEPDLSDGNHAYVALATQVLGPWIGTLALVGIAAASISTSSTILMVTAQALSRDVAKPFLGGSDSRRVLLNVSRASVVIVGVLAGVIGLAKPLGIFWLVVLSTSLLGGTFFVPIVFGLLSPKASGKAAIASMIAGAVATSLVFILNKTTGGHWFVHEFFAGLFFSVLVWVIAIKKYPAGQEERIVAHNLVGHQV